MGSRRTAIAPIGNSKNRRVTFAKRKQGLFKKAWEMSVLTQCEVLLVLRDVRGRLFQFAACFPTNLNAPDPAARTREPTNLVPRPHNGDVEQWIQRIATGRAGPVVETRTPFYYDKGCPNLVPSDAPANEDDDDDDDEADDVDGEDESTTGASSSAATSSATTATSTTGAAGASSIDDPFNLDHLLSGSNSASNVHDADTQVVPSVHHPAAHAALLPFQPLHRSNSGRRRTVLHMPGSAPIVSTTISRNPRRKVSIHRRASQKNKRTSSGASNPLMGALDMCTSPINVDPVDWTASGPQSSSVKFNPANERAEAQLVANYYAVHGPPTTPNINASSPPPPLPHTGTGASLGRRGTVAVRRPKREAPGPDPDANTDAANKRARAAPPMSSFQPNELAAAGGAPDPNFLLHVPGASAPHYASGHTSPSHSALSSPGVGSSSANGMLSPYTEGAGPTASGTASSFDHMLMSLSATTSSSTQTSSNPSATSMPMVPDIFLTDPTHTSTAAFAASIHAHSPMHLTSSTPRHLATSTPMYTSTTNGNNAGMSPVMLDTGNGQFATSTPLMGPYSPAMALVGANASTTPQMLPTTVAPSPFLLATAFQQQQQQQQYISPINHAAPSPFAPEFSISVPPTSSGFLSVSTATSAAHHHLSPHMSAFPTTSSPLANAGGGLHGVSPYLTAGAPHLGQQPMLSPLDQALGTPLTSAAPTPIMLSMDGSSAAVDSASQQLAHILGPPSTDPAVANRASDVLMMSAASSMTSQPATGSGLSQVIAGLAAPSDFLGVAQPLDQPHAQDAGGADGDQDSAFVRMWFASPTPGLGSSAGMTSGTGGSGDVSEESVAQ